MKVALYARVSTDDQGQNPETQLFRLRQLAQARSYEITGEYVDYASGKDARRPKLQEMLEDARNHRFDKILILRLDRMMRSVTNLWNVLNDLERWGVGLECADQSIDTQSPQGRFTITIVGAVAEYERDLTRTRVKEGMARAKAEGKHCGRPRKQ